MLRLTDHQRSGTLDRLGTGRDVVALALFWSTLRVVAGADGGLELLEKFLFNFFSFVYDPSYCCAVTWSENNASSDWFISEYTHHRVFSGLYQILGALYLTEYFPGT